MGSAGIRLSGNSGRSRVDVSARGYPAAFLLAPEQTLLEARVSFYMFGSKSNYPVLLINDSVGFLIQRDAACFGNCRDRSRRRGSGNPLSVRDSQGVWGPVKTCPWF